MCSAASTFTNVHGRPAAGTLHMHARALPKQSKAKPAAHSKAPSLTGNPLPYWMAVGQMASSRLVALALAVSRRRTVTAPRGRRRGPAANSDFAAASGSQPLNKQATTRTGSCARPYRANVIPVEAWSPVGSRPHILGPLACIPSFWEGARRGCAGVGARRLDARPVRSAYQPPASSTFFHNKLVTSNQLVVLFFQNKTAPVIGHQPTDQAESLITVRN
jgi:hypothetical protein